MLAPHSVNPEIAQQSGLGALTATLTVSTPPGPGSAVAVMFSDGFQRGPGPRASHWCFARRGIPVRHLWLGRTSQ
jgi:hypothetical protein